MVVLLDSAMLTAVRVSQGGPLFPCSPTKLPHNQKFRTAWPQACAQHANTIKTWRQMIEEMRGKFNCFHLLLLSLKLQLSPA